MALVFLLVVFFVVILAIAGVVFQPSKWLEWFYGGKK